MTVEQRAAEWAALIDASKTPEDWTLRLLIAMNSLRAEFPEYYGKTDNNRTADR